MQKTVPNEHKTSINLENVNKINLVESDDLTKDKFLQIQMDEYMKSILNGNLDIVTDYSYPDILVWINDKYPNTINNREDFKRIYLEPMKRLNEIKKNNEITVEYEVGEITKRLQSQDGKTMIYLIISSISIKQNLEESKKGDENVAISFDGGKNWTFMIKDIEITNEILDYKFSNETINKLLTN